MVFFLFMLSHLLKGNPFEHWQHTGTVAIITTPEGANLPASAKEENVPVLIRFNKDHFNFKEADPSGKDIRFSYQGTMLPYEIEEWDAKNQRASIWVRVPEIKGNTIQTLKVHWGNSNAVNKSKGDAVFNKSNHFVTVCHLEQNERDVAGILEIEDNGTQSSRGVIGPCRYFSGKDRLDFGKNIKHFPQGASSHSSSAWIKGEVSNGIVMSWGLEKAQGKVVMALKNPPHVRMDCYFSNANIKSTETIEMEKWVHVVHTYGGERGAEIYINGECNNNIITRGRLLNIADVVRFQIGSHYNGRNFKGAIDECRISSVKRSADWVKLQYENQKPLQTLVGHVMKNGKEFSVFENQVVMNETETVKLQGVAEGSSKVCWVKVQDGQEKVIGVDQFSVDFKAGRVSQNQKYVIEFRALYGRKWLKKFINIEVKESIPDPIFTLKAPTHWDGRKTIEVSSHLTNLLAMESASAGELKYIWDVSGMAVIKKTEGSSLVLNRSQNSGLLKVSLKVSNGGDLVTQVVNINVKEPQSDPWVNRVPDPDEKPSDNQFYARTDENMGVMYCNGEVHNGVSEMSLKVYANETLYKEIKKKTTDKKNYSFKVLLKPGLIKYRVELLENRKGLKNIIHKAGNIVCGDAYLINGQSNALATDTREESPPEIDEWVRSYAKTQFYQEGVLQNLWCNPVWKLGKVGRLKKEPMSELGWWGMELAKQLVEKHKFPVFMLNAAVGGTRIDQHQRSSKNPQDLKTIYGRMLWRLRQAKLTHGIKAVIWHQGENNQGSAGPDADYGWKNYHRHFVNMSASWKEDFPNIKRYFVFQIWPNACSMGNGGHGDRLREKQRTLSNLYSNMDMMSTLGIEPSGSCHFPLKGWSEFAHLLSPLIGKEFYGEQYKKPLTAANLQKSYYSNSSKNEIKLEFDQNIVWNDSLISEFYLNGKKGLVHSGRSEGKTLVLKLKESSEAPHITYIKENSWSQKRLLKGENGIPALTFCEVPLTNNLK